MARPVKTEGKLCSPVSFRLTEEEYQKFQAKVEHSGMSASAFFRSCILTNKTQMNGQLMPLNRQRDLLFMINIATRKLIELCGWAELQHQRGSLDAADFQFILRELQAIQERLLAGIHHAD